ncbi:hypothetical protein JCM21900_003495 [Sporobolomyces salmonicolor]
MVRPTALFAVVATVAAHCAAAALLVQDAKLSVIDSVGASAVASTSFSSDAPAPLPLTVLSATDTLKLTFTVTDDQGQPIQPHQAMISWQPRDPEERNQPGRDHASVVKVRSGGKARWELDLARAPPSLLSLTRAHLTATLLLGTRNHPGLSLPLGTFTFAPSLSLPFPYPPDDDLPTHWEVHKYKSQPEIQWTFRQKEKQINAVVALAGLGLVLAPWVVFLGVVAHRRPTLSVARPSVTQALFLLSIAAFEALFLVYWIGLRLIPTLPYFGALGLWTAWIGRRALGEMRSTRVRGEKQTSGKTH